MANSPGNEAAVRAWWNALTPEQRAAEAANCGADGNGWDGPVTDDWDRLLSIGQQMKLHMAYDSALQGVSLLYPPSTRMTP
jgi:hypothetical protein